MARGRLTRPVDIVRKEMAGRPAWSKMDGRFLERQSDGLMVAEPRAAVALPRDVQAKGKPKEQDKRKSERRESKGEANVRAVDAKIKALPIRSVDISVMCATQAFMRTGFEKTSHTISLSCIRLCVCVPLPTHPHDTAGRRYNLTDPFASFVRATLSHKQCFCENGGLKFRSQNSAGFRVRS